MRCSMELQIFGQRHRHAQLNRQRRHHALNLLSVTLILRTQSDMLGLLATTSRRYDSSGSYLPRHHRKPLHHDIHAYTANNVLTKSPSFPLRFTFRYQDKNKTSVLQVADTTLCWRRLRFSAGVSTALSRQRWENHRASFCVQPRTR